MALLCEDILHSEQLLHSYPYDWRTKQPVILRASWQWFIDTNAIKQKAIVSYILGTFHIFRHVCKIVKSDSFVMSVRPSAWNDCAATGWISTKFYV